jgi:hypothetical protein
MPMNIEQNDFFRPERKYIFANFSGLKTSVKMPVYRRPVHKMAYYQWFWAEKCAKPAIHAGFGAKKRFHPSLFTT